MTAIEAADLPTFRVRPCLISMRVTNSTNPSILLAVHPWWRCRVYYEDVACVMKNDVVCAVFLCSLVAWYNAHVTEWERFFRDSSTSWIPFFQWLDSAAVPSWFFPWRRSILPHSKFDKPLLFYVSTFVIIGPCRYHMISRGIHTSASHAKTNSQPYHRSCSYSSTSVFFGALSLA